MEAVILAGGRGTRMGNLTSDCPKPMIHLGGKPILEYQINLAKRYGYSDILMLTGYKENVIKEYFKTGIKWGVNIEYYSDPNPLGTAGSVKEIEGLLQGPFFLFYGDTMLDVDLDALMNSHRENNGIATLVAHPNDHPQDSDLMDIDEYNRIIAFYSNPHDNKQQYHRNLVNAALYVLTPEIFKYIEKGNYSDFGKDVFPKLISLDRSIYAYSTTEYIKDIGTVDRLIEVEEDYRTSKIRRLNKSNKQKAIFIDRDGVINHEADPLNAIEKFRFLPGIPDAMKMINSSDYLGVLVTNQPIIAKGLSSEREVSGIHNYMEYVLGKNGAYFDRIYYCPHHPEEGHKGERKDYKIPCKCRKPDTGMIDQAVLDMNIDLEQSFIVGDRTVDIMTGVNANLQTVLVRQGYGGKDRVYDCRPDYVFNDLQETVQFIVYGYDRLLDIIKKTLSNKDTTVKENQVIAIGGLSRSGKSTFSSVLLRYLKAVGKRVKIIRLDNWLVSDDERTPDMNVRDRYDYSSIRADVNALLEGQMITGNRNHPNRRKGGQNVESVFLEASDILIIEGEVALDHDYIREKATISYYTEISEGLRKKRFYDYCHYSLFTENQISSLYEKRNTYEEKIIEQSREFATHKIDMDLIG